MHTVDIAAQEYVGTHDRVVNMCFGCCVYDVVAVVESIQIVYIRFHKLELLWILPFKNANPVLIGSISAVVNTNDLPTASQARFSDMHTYKAQATSDVYYFFQILRAFTNKCQPKYSRTASRMASGMAANQGSSS